ncbi:hypothetical protein BO71DRAFT_404455 [Aspergillus ellipticus CBS 707.79]|uniref:CENP-V/GFA domain-containing protein n=1 Tax=Aspergillus ellipticus CBS 707.79 TaxID=1448320 RepID=A0A319CR34_9EURO|nr:hypothetical protein BO71DRAFT_404455 [Aspergillus ellipticus CBS 707.79]
MTDPSSTTTTTTTPPTNTTTTTTTTTNPQTPPQTPGSCLCGGITYEITGDPVTRLLCHCDNCRKASGSSFMANSFLNASQFKILTGAALIQSYLDSGTDSGGTISRNFCRVCGSPLFATHVLHKEFLAVMSGTMDGARAEAWRPENELFCRRRRRFLAPVEGTRVFVEGIE